MKIIEAVDVNVAFDKGVKLIREEGIRAQSRNGLILTIPYPVATILHYPVDRVLFNSARDANPFFHLMESLWILAGANDVKFPSYFNSRMSDYSDDGKTFYGAYGGRLRHSTTDQLKDVIHILKTDKYTRQATCTIWRDEDLTKTTADKPCNLSFSFLYNQQTEALDMTVMCRSNDMLWGAYGTNVVQFTMIHEYVASFCGYYVGKHYRISNSFHIYTGGAGGDLWNKVKDNSAVEYPLAARIYPCGKPLFAESGWKEGERFDSDCHTLLCRDGLGNMCVEKHSHRLIWETEWFSTVVAPMLSAYQKYKEKNISGAVIEARRISSEDWREVCVAWLQRRL